MRGRRCTWATGRWVSSKPTPQQPRGEVAAEGVVGPGGVNTTTPRTGVGSQTTAPPPTAPLTVPMIRAVPSGIGNMLSPSPVPAPGAPGLGSVWWALIGAAFVLVVVLVLLLIRRRRRWSPRAARRGRWRSSPKPRWTERYAVPGSNAPCGNRWRVFFEDLSPPDAGRFDTEPATTSAARERSASLIQDGVTVAHAADAALFDPLGTSDVTSRAAYEAALRIRKDLSRHQLASRHE